jgi:hypothetical protein
MDGGKALDYVTRAGAPTAEQEDVLRALPHFLHQPSAIMVPRQWRRLPPAYSPNARVMTPERQALDEFFSTDLYIDSVSSLLARGNIQFFILPKSSLLTEQF